MLNNLIMIDLKSVNFCFDLGFFVTLAAMFSLIPLYVADLYVFGKRLPLIKNIRTKPNRKLRTLVSFSCIVDIVVVSGYWFLVLSDLIVGKLHLIEMILLAIYTPIIIPFLFNLSLSMTLGFDVVSSGDKLGFSKMRFAIALVALTLLVIVSLFTSFAILET